MATLPMVEQLARKRWTFQANAIVAGVSLWLVLAASPVHAYQYGTGLYGSGAYNGVTSSSYSSSTSSTAGNTGGGTTGRGGGGGRRNISSILQTSIPASSVSLGSIGGGSEMDITALSRDGYLFITPQDSSRPILFRDVPTSSWFATSIARVIQIGIVSGYKDANGNPLGLFGPADPVTYAELAKMSLEAAGLSPDASSLPNGRAARHWASDYIALATKRGLSAFKHTLDIDLPATRGDVIQTLLEVFSIPLDTTITSAFKDLRSTNPAANAISTAARLGIITGDTDKNGEKNGTVRPNDTVNRAETAKIVSRVVEYVKSLNTPQ